MPILRLFRPSGREKARRPRRRSRRFGSRGETSLMGLHSFNLRLHRRLRGINIQVCLIIRIYGSSGIIVEKIHYKGITKMRVNRNLSLRNVCLSAVSWGQFHRRCTKPFLGLDGRGLYPRTLWRRFFSPTPYVLGKSLCSRLLTYLPKPPETFSQSIHFCIYPVMTRLWN